MIGPYVAACRNAGDPACDGGLESLFDAVAAHLGEYGLGSVSERADGDSPHRASGSPFHACSVAELFRVWQMVN